MLDKDSIDGYLHRASEMVPEQSELFPRNAGRGRGIHEMTREKSLLGTVMGILVLSLAAMLVGGCTLASIWKCVIGYSNCGLGSANQSTTVTHVEPPPIPCSGGKITSPILVTLNGTAYMVPSTQYCFVRISGAQDWCSAPQSFGQGTTTLSFSGFGLDNAVYEVVVGLTPDTAVANAGDASSATVVKKVQMNLTSAGTKKCPLIEYNCMAGYDIRGPGDTTSNDNIFKYVTKRFDPCNIATVFVEHSLSLQAQVFSSMYEVGGVQEFLQKTWVRRFLFDSTDADFCLIAIQNCANRANFYGQGIPLGDSVIGLSGAVPFDTLGQNTGSWSLAFKFSIDSLLNQSSRQAGYNRTAVHELGHVMGSLSHPFENPELHNGGVDANCIMNLMDYYGPAPGQIASGKDKFCTKCRDSLRTVQWTQGKAHR